MSNFDLAIQYVLQNEGGLSNRAADRGGATNFGITQALLEKYQPGNTVQQLTVEEAKIIYNAAFWFPMKLESLPQLQATCILDMAVNMGEHWAVKCAQLACSLDGDGVMGPKTIAALNTDENDKWLHDFLIEIKNHYVSICIGDPSQIQFLNGWLNRAIRMILLLSP